jgi:uncharacterized protein YndB with AHSA1/START domain
MSETIEAIRREVVVDVGPARAFELFTRDMTAWWPARHHIGSAPIEEILIEPRTGGRWYTRHQDGTETDNGTVAVWNPPGRLVITWQIGSDWKFHTDLVTIVDIRFEPLGDDRTRVKLEHRDLEAFGADAAKMKDVFSEPDAWTGTLAAYAAAAAGPTS